MIISIFDEKSTMTTRQEHLDWCKEQALVYLDRDSAFYNVSNALTSMISDMRKHEETRKMLASEDVQFAIKVTMAETTHDSVKGFIKGFN